MDGFQISPPVRMSLLLIAILLFCPSPTRSAEATSAKKAAGAIKKVVGRALDAEGRPVAGATVCLTRHNDSEDEPSEPTLLAQTQSQADGRFELNALDSEIKKALADPPRWFEIWIQKKGLALAHRAIFGEPTEQPQIVTMSRESLLAIQIHDPHGSPCGGASVKPIFMWLDNGRCVVIPKSIQDLLKTRTAVDGGATVSGFRRELATVAIETAQFGVQNCAVSTLEARPVAIALRETRILGGRVILPKEVKADLTKLSLSITVISRLKDSDDKAKTCKLGPSMPPPGTWFDHFLLRPDRDGRFTIAKFPKNDHGYLYFCVSMPNDVPLTNDIHFPTPSFDVPQGKPVNIEIPLQKEVVVTRIVGDARTKRPLARVALVMTSPEGFTQADTSDESGRLRLGLCPGVRYHVHCSLPTGYLRARTGSEADVLVPCGVDRCELKPIELVQGCTVNGELLDADGRPLAGVKIRGSWRAADAHSGKGEPADVSHWATTDSAGHFRLEGIEAGTTLTLLPVRAGIPLADPMLIAAADDKPIRLQEKKGASVALGGRILGVDRKPIPGAQIAVEVERSPDQPRTYRTTVDSDGEFQTPGNFPKQLKYRLVVRSMLMDVASSDWMCPANSGNRFPDLVVERARLGLDTRLFGKEIVARVNGRPIVASDILERAYADPLPPAGVSLLVASKGIVSGAVTEQEFRVLQDTAIKKYMADFVRTRMLAQALEAKLQGEYQKTIEQAIGKMFDEYVEKLKRDMQVASRQALDHKLQRQGTSLAGLKVEFRYRLLADEYVRRSARPDSDIDWQRALAYYQAHRDLYAVREKISWQLLEIEFDHSSLQQANHSQKAAADDRDPWDRTPKSQAARKVRSVDDGLQVNLGIFDPNSDQPNTSQSEKNSSPETTESDKTGTDSNKDRADIDVVKYADQLPVRLDPRKARGMMDQALAQLRKGEPFDVVVKKFSNGPHADQGGWQARISVSSVADEKTAAALRQLPEGETSGVIETDHSFRIVRVACRTPACPQPFEEVEESIRQAIQRDSQKQALEELYSQTSIESPYLDDISSILQPPPPCPTPKAQDDAFAP